MNKIAGFLTLLLGVIITWSALATPGDQILQSGFGGALVGMGFVGLLVW